MTLLLLSPRADAYMLFSTDWIATVLPTVQLLVGEFVALPAAKFATWVADRATL